MAAKAKPATKPASKAAPKPSGFSAEEKAAMKEAIAERKAAAAGADGAKALAAAIAAMAEPDRSLAKRVDALVKANAPSLSPRTWYGMPAYARGEETVVFFQSGKKYKSRYCTLGFTDKAKLDDGRIWPASFAVAELTAADEAKIAALLKRAVG